MVCSKVLDQYFATFRPVCDLTLTGDNLEEFDKNIKLLRDMFVCRVCRKLLTKMKDKVLTPETCMEHFVCWDCHGKDRTADNKCDKCEDWNVFGVDETLRLMLNQYQAFCFFLITDKRFTRILEVKQDIEHVFDAIPLIDLFAEGIEGTRFPKPKEYRRNYNPPDLLPVPINTAKQAKVVVEKGRKGSGTNTNVDLGSDGETHNVSNDSDSDREKSPSGKSVGEGEKDKADSASASSTKHSDSDVIESPVSLKEAQNGKGEEEQVSNPSTSSENLKTRPSTETEETFILPDMNTSGENTPSQSPSSSKCGSPVKLTQPKNIFSSPSTSAQQKIMSGGTVTPGTSTTASPVSVGGVGELLQPSLLPSPSTSPSAVASATRMMTSMAVEATSSGGASGFSSPSTSVTVAAPRVITSSATARMPSPITLSAGNALFPVPPGLVSILARSNMKTFKINHGGVVKEYRLAGPNVRVPGGQMAVPIPELRSTKPAPAASSPSSTSTPVLTPRSPAIAVISPSSFSARRPQTNVQGKRLDARTFLQVRATDGIHGFRMAQIMRGQTPVAPPHTRARNPSATITRPISIDGDAPGRVAVGRDPNTGQTLFVDASTLNRVPGTLMPQGSGLGSVMITPQQPPQPPNQKKLDCKCGSSSTNPGNLTCIGQRCVCYANRNACEDCKCKGCKNPYIPGGAKKKPQGAVPVQVSMPSSQPQLQSQNIMVDPAQTAARIAWDHNMPLPVNYASRVVGPSSFAGMNNDGSFMQQQQPHVATSGGYVVQMHMPQLRNTTPPGQPQIIQIGGSGQGYPIILQQNMNMGGPPIQVPFNAGGYTIQSVPASMIQSFQSQNAMAMGFPVGQGTRPSQLQPQQNQVHGQGQMETQMAPPPPTERRQ